MAFSQYFLALTVVKVAKRVAQIMDVNLHLGQDRSSHQRCSIKKGVLKNLTKFTGPSDRLQAYNFITKENLAQGFSCEFYEIFKNTFFIEHRCFCLDLNEG